MPGLKGAARKPILGVENILSIMDRREKGLEDLQAIKDIPTKLKSTSIPVKSDRSLGSSIYEKNFKRIGSTTRKRYESGNLPHLHKLYFEAIKKNMNGQQKAQVKLAPILEELGMSRTISISILACLEHYGYLRLTRAQSRGRELVFELLED